VKQLLVLTAAIEALTGLALIVHPSLVVQMLLKADLSNAGITLGRITGFALIALGVACWPRQDASESQTSALRAMLVYNVLAALYLTYLGIADRGAGVLLWPAALTHAVLTVLLTRAAVRRLEVNVIDSHRDLGGK
jgi:hypothetical protein